MGERNTAFAQKAIAVSLSTSEVWLCPMKVSDMEQKWYNMRHGHERRNAHVAAARRQDEVFSCIPHGRGALI